MLLLEEGRVLAFKHADGQRDVEHADLHHVSVEWGSAKTVGVVVMDALNL